MYFLAQVKTAFTQMPMLYQIITVVWSLIPFCHALINYSTLGLYGLLFLFLFALIWTMMSFAIMIGHVFFKRHKTQIDKHAKSNSITINGQTIAAALQSKEHYKKLVLLLPPELSNNQGLYVSATLGNLAKNIMLGLVVIHIIYLFVIKQS
jgi:hypothetical protein